MKDNIQGRLLPKGTDKRAFRGQGMILVTNTTKDIVLNIGVKAPVLCHFYNGLKPGETVYFRTGAVLVTVEVVQQSVDMRTNYSKAAVITYNSLFSIGCATVGAAAACAIVADVATTAGAGTTATSAGVAKGFVAMEMTSLSLPAVKAAPVAIGAVAPTINTAVGTATAAGKAAAVLATVGASALGAAVPDMLVAPVSKFFVKAWKSPHLNVDKVYDDGICKLQLT